ncbi:MAG: deoxyribose-phosphate aldolase [Hydrogenothermus sp.]|nr:MAG: deoxyribose-phosphate aldolase [Hydrogenothermus sp.]
MDLYLRKKIEHTNLKPDASKEDIKKTIDESIKYGFYGVCIPPCYVSYAKKLTKDTNIKIITVIGFPNGYNKIKTKLIEAMESYNDGADEIDIVWNISLFKSRQYEYVLEELKTIISYTKGITHKVIVETAYLTEEEKRKAVEIVIQSGAEYIKTSTGFALSGAKLGDVKLFKELSNGKIKIKASGGIRDFETALKFLEAGADKIGTSSGVKIIEDARKRNS